MNNKKRKINLLIISIFLLFLIVPIGCKILYDVIEVYNLNIDNIPKDYFTNYKSFINLEVYTMFFTKHKNPVIGIGWIIIIYLSFNMLFNNVLKTDETYTQTDEYGSHGTARWQTIQEIKDNYYKDDVGWFFGSNEKNKIYSLDMEAACHPVDGDLNMQLTVIGPPGSKKTTGFVLPNIFHLVNAYEKRNNEKLWDTDKKISNVLKKIKRKIKNNYEMPDFIITDPKPEIYPLTANYLKEKGYDIKVLDFIDFRNGDKINPLDFIYDDKTLMEIAHGYVNSVSGATQDGKSGGEEAFWNEQEAQVLAALIGYVKQKYPKEKQTFREVIKLLTSKNVTEDYEFLFEDAGITGAAKQMWNNYIMFAKSEKTTSNIVGGLAGKLKLFGIDEINSLTEETTIDITKLGDKKENPMALFILMPDEDQTYSPVINVIINILHKQLYKTARKYRNRLANPVYEILEEMANIGKLDRIEQLLGTMRGRRIYPMMIWQSLSQMKSRYKYSWEDMLSMCDTHIYLAINDDFTANYCSKSLGPTTVRIKGVSQKGDKGLLTYNSKTESDTYIQRNLLFPNECRELDRNKTIIIQGSRKPALLYKTIYKHWKEENRICEPIDFFEKEERDNNSIKENILQKEYEVKKYKEEKDIEINKNLEEIRIDKEKTQINFNDDMLKELKNLDKER